MSGCVKLGYYPHHCGVCRDDISLVDLPNREQSIAGIKECATIHNGWIYAPLKQQQNFMSGRITTLPHSARIFGLPKTHVLTHKNADSADHLEFLVWCIGFFTGMRLTTTEAGFLDATPIEPGQLNDFVLMNCTLTDALNLSESFWQKHKENDRNIKLLVGIINALFLSQYPPALQFEEFTYLYIALDACFALTRTLLCARVRPSHGARIQWMCQQFGIPTPDWALPNAQKATEVSLVRNDTLHEALFFDQPLGFAIYGANSRPSGQRNVPLEMSALTCRLLVALLGRPDSEYVRSPVNTRQIHGLDLS